MKKISLNLPKGKRLDLQLVQTRKKHIDNSFFSDMTKILKTKKGSKLSRFFRIIFERKKIKKFLGTNLAFFSIIASFLPTQSNEIRSEKSPITKTSVPVVLTTKISTSKAIDTNKISQPYSFSHPGIDYDGITGDPVYSILDGKVEAVQYSNTGYGNAIYVVHDGGVSSLYAHLYQILVQKGDNVSAGEQIGTVGETGRATGDHLHLEVRQNSVPTNPQTIFGALE